MEKRVTYHLYVDHQLYEYYDEEDYEEMLVMYQLLKETNSKDEIKVERELVYLEEIKIEKKYDKKDFKEFVIDLLRENKSLKNEIEELNRSYDNAKSELKSRPSGIRDNY